jgi:hypothetical protein
MKRSKAKPKTRTYELVWADDTEMAGLEVKFRAMPIGELEKLGTMYSQFQADDGDEEDERSTTEKLKLLTDLIDRLGKVILAWNRSDENTMVWDDETEEFVETPDTVLLPANAWGLRQIPDWEFMEILKGYFTQAVGVDTDLGKDSSSGASSLAELPMTEQ